MVVDDLRTFEIGRAKVQNTVFRQLFYIRIVSPRLKSIAEK